MADWVFPSMQISFIFSWAFFQGNCLSSEITRGIVHNNLYIDRVKFMLNYWVAFISSTDHAKIYAMTDTSI